MKFQAKPLEQLISAIFARAGSEQDEADVIAQHLVKANLVGHDSHGVIRTPIYIEWLRDGKVFVNRKLKVIFETPSILVVDGQMGYGQSVVKQAVDLGLDKCQEQGLSVVALRNSGHIGRVGHWAELATDAECVSLHFVNTTGLGMLMVPAGGIDRRLSINPVTIGVPVAGKPAVIFDIAAAAAAEGKLKVARNRGVSVPDGWILDADGQPTNDPNEFYGPPRGAILPFGGHKGYGLGLMAELLAGALTGSGCSQEGKTGLEQGMLSIYIDPTKIGTEGGFDDEVSRYVDFVRSSRADSPDGKVLVPGDLEAQNQAERLATGIELDDATWNQITTTAQDLEVDAARIDAATGTD